MKEQWRDIAGFEGLYEVSDYGRIRSLGRFKFRPNGRIMTQSLSSNGYYSVNLCGSGKSTSKTVHQLVACAFLDHNPCGYKMVVNHKDLNKLNNHVSNLEIITQRQNTNRQHKPHSSKYTGVYWCNTRNRWVSVIMINGKQKRLGRFKSEIQAHEKYQEVLKTVLTP